MQAVNLNKNIPSLTAQRRLQESTNSLARSFERLSSGMRINRASDDSAGLAIAESLRANTRVYTQGIRNLNDGISLLNIADGAIEQLSSITFRLTELAAQAANGAYSTIQRKALDTEAQALSKEFLRIARSTKFNGVSLFDSSMGELRLQGGYGVDGSIASNLGGALWSGINSSASFSADLGINFSNAVLGDLNGDGTLDLVSISYNRALVWLGTGNGSFGSPTSYIMDATYTNSVALGDLNGDGILDLVSGGYTGGDGSLTVRLGNGNGTFGSAISYDMGMMQESTSIVLADFNGDGILDALTSGLYGSANVRLGNGDGTFGQATSYAMAESDVAVGDINGDGILDMVAVGYGVANVRFGNGDGTFGAVSTYSSGMEYAHNVLLEDLNNDGYLDLIISGTDGGTGAVSLRLGTSSGTFGAANNFSMGGSLTNNAPIGLNIADLDGDGVLDLIVGGVAGGFGSGVTIRKGKGDGTFLSATSYLLAAPSSSSKMAITLGDLNGDGVLDFVTNDNQDPGTGISTFLSTTTSGIQPLLPFSLQTMADAKQALPILERKRDQLASQRGIIGAFQARTTIASNNLSAAKENFLTAESRIRDADLASETANTVRLSILQQAATAVLAQANLQPSLAITLLS